MSFNKLYNELVSSILTKNVAIAVGSIMLLTISTKYLLRLRWYLKKKSYPKDVVVLHQFPRGYLVPNLSPFVLKLETWLRMNNIKYQNEHGFTFGPKGKIPFITYNGQDVGDSSFCIEFLSKTFNKALNKDHSAKDLGAARAFQKMSEESLFWVCCLSRFIYDRNPAMFGMPLPALWFLAWYYRKHFYVQGYGRHSKEELFSIGKKDLKGLNDFLEGKKFLIGDKPCNEDASIFGITAQFVYSENGTLNQFIRSECPNIVSYTENMKNTYWPDWDDCIEKKKEEKKKN